MVGEIGPSPTLIKDNKADPMFEWSWGYYSVFDADAILYDVMKCSQPYSYYCNKALDDLVIQGRSTLDTKKRTEIYAKAQKLLYDDAALSLQVGAAGRVGHQQPHRVRGAARRGRPDVRRDPAEEVAGSRRRATQRP